MIYEFRTYHCVPGKLPLLLERFERTTLGIWEKHGIRQLGFWTVQIGASSQDLHYILQWPSLAVREESWKTFQSDPEWRVAREETERDGPLVLSVANMILTPTAFSNTR